MRRSFMCKINVCMFVTCVSHLVSDAACSILLEFINGVISLDLEIGSYRLLFVAKVPISTCTRYLIVIYMFLVLFL